MNIKVVVITHGKFGEELVNTVFGILGKQENVESISVVSDVNLEFLCEKINQVSKDNVDHVVLLTDMLGGTACNAGLMVCKNYENIHIISGVNLYMLITAVTLRENVTDINEYIKKIISAGKNSIDNVKEKFLKKLYK